MHLKMDGTIVCKDAHIPDTVINKNKEVILL